MGSGSGFLPHFMDVHTDKAPPENFQPHPYVQTKMQIA